MDRRSKLTVGLFLCLLVLLVLNTTLTAQTTGKIQGKVVDAKTNEPLIGANITIAGTQMGAAADFNGDFFIINVPPGRYNLRVSMLGYENQVIQNVTVSVNRSSNVAAKLTETVLAGEEVVVTAEKISLKKDQTSSIKNVSAENIALLPVENIDQIIEMQAGVVGGHVRGGRLNEVSYLIDGMQVDETFSGERSTIQLEKEVVQDLEVITGTFNAEYGKAMSGIINMVTKEGSNQFHGSAFAHFGNYVTSNDDIFIGLKPGDFDRKQDYRIQLEGPVWKDRLFFIANVRYVRDDGYLNGIRRFNVDDFSNLISPDLLGEGLTSPWDTEINGNRYYSEHTGDGAFVPLLDYEHTSYFGKLSFRPFNNLKLSLLYTGNKKDEPLGYSSDEGGNNSYQHSYKYCPDALMRDHYESSMLSFQLNHMVNSRMFYDFKVSRNDDWSGRYLYEDPFDPRYVSVLYGRSVGGFVSGGTPIGRSDTYSDQYIAKLDLTWQIDKHHSIKSGFQYSKYRIENKPTIVRDVKWKSIGEVTKANYDPELQRIVVEPFEAEIFPAESIEMDRYVKEPYDMSAYIQDKMEYDMLVINYGLRYDYFNANAQYPSNRQNPANQGEYDDPSFQSTYIDADPQVQVSPRLGLSYTLGRSAVLHFSYGHFFQMPPFYALYANHRFMVPNNNFGIEHGNAELKAQKTVKYEMGIWQELTPGLGLELSVYYSDIYDLLTAVVWTTYNQIQYAVFDNKDYANTKGLEVKLDYASGPVVLNLNYTLQYTRGNADNPRSTYNRLAQNQDPIPKLIPLSWDQRHTFNLNLGYTTNRYALSVTGFINSGFPYNIEPILDSRLARQNITPNTGKKPSNYRIDLQGHYDIPINSRFKLRFYLYVKNLLDRLNEEHVYGSTGRAYTTILGNTAFETFRSNYNTIYDQFQNPGMYSAPREIKLGFGLMF